MPVVMQTRLLVKILPRIPQVKGDCSYACRPKALIQISIRKPVLRYRWFFFAKGTVRPLPCDLAVGLDRCAMGFAANSI